MPTWVIVSGMVLLPDDLVMLSVVVILGVGGWIANALFRRSRSERLRAFALHRNLKLVERYDLAEVAGALEEKLSHFDLFMLSDERSVDNILRTQAGDLDLTIFDYWYDIGETQGKKIHTHTVILFESSALDLPQFRLRPEAPSDRFFYHLDPTFSSRYWPDGDPGLDKLYTPEVLS